MPKVDLSSVPVKSGGDFDNSENAAIYARCFYFARKADIKQTTFLPNIRGLK